MRIIDANNVVKDILKERDKVPLTLHFGEAFRGGIRKALRCIEQAPTVDAVPVSELLALRDELYEKDQITINGIRNLNSIIANHESTVTSDELQ